MLKQSIIIAALAVASLSQVAHARDTELKLPIKAVLDRPDYAEKVGTQVKFYFGSDKKVPSTNLGEFVTNKKTNAFGKSDEEACQWAMLSALIELRDRALKEGGTQVVDVNSYYKKNEFRSNTEYECHAGGVIAGVALKATVLK